MYVVKFDVLFYIFGTSAHDELDTTNFLFRSLLFEFRSVPLHFRVGFYLSPKYTELKVFNYNI